MKKENTRQYVTPTGIVTETERTVTRQGKSYKRWEATYYKSTHYVDSNGNKVEKEK